MKELYSWQRKDGCLQEKAKVPGMRMFMIQPMPWEPLQIWKLRTETGASGYTNIIVLPGNRSVLRLLSLWLLKNRMLSQKVKISRLSFGKGLNGFFPEKSRTAAGNISPQAIWQSR